MQVAARTKRRLLADTAQMMSPFESICFNSTTTNTFFVENSGPDDDFPPTCFLKAFDSIVSVVLHPYVKTVFEESSQVVITASEHLKFRESEYLVVLGARPAGRDDQIMTSVPKNEFSDTLTKKKKIEEIHVKLSQLSETKASYKNFISCTIVEKRMRPYKDGSGRMLILVVKDDEDCVAEVKAFKDSSSDFVEIISEGDRIKLKDFQIKKNDPAFQRYGSHGIVLKKSSEVTYIL